MNGDLLDLEALSSLPEGLMEAFRDALRTAEYDSRILGEAEGIAPRQFDAVRLPLVQSWLTRQPGTAPLLARLFSYRDSLGRDEVFQALGPDVAGALEACGVFVPHGDRLRSLMRLIPFGRVWIASDDADARFDPVMGPGATTQELLTTLPTPMPARVLDVGCGAGSLALAAARAGAASVTAIDLDPRAVALTRWNARLNDLEVAAHAGDLLAPVRDRQFDLILAQPPFVPQPPGVEATTYLHGGARGDELALRLLGELPSAMAPGGRALLLVDTAPPPGQATVERIRDALPEIPLQLSVVTAMGHEAHALAVGYAAAADSTLGPDYADAAQRYATHVETLGITHTRHALVVLRKPLPNEPSWAISVEPREHTIYRAPLLRRLDAAMALATLAPDDLKKSSVRPPRGAQLVQSHPLDDESETTFRFVGPRSRAPDQALSSAAVRLLDLVVQTDTVGALIDAYAESCEDEPERVEGAVVDFLRKALVSGMLEPREESSS